MLLNDARVDPLAQNSQAVKNANSVGDTTMIQLLQRSRKPSPIRFSHLCLNFVEFLKANADPDIAINPIELYLEGK